MKKITLFITTLLLMFSILTPTQADRLDELKTAVSTAEVRLAHAKSNLYLVNKVAYRILMDHPYSERFQRAEKYLRENYPNEYWEYIQAKAQLEELQELYFYAAMNEIKGDNENV